MAGRGTFAAASAVLAAFAMVSGNAEAQNRQACTIIVGDNGTLKANPGATTLSSSNAGGRSGSAIVSATNSSYELVVDAPFGFSFQPAGGSENTTFSASMSAAGATQFASVPSGVSRRIKRGQTEVTVDFAAKRNAGSFPAGNYTATVVLRCE